MIRVATGLTYRPRSPRDVSRCAASLGNARTTGIHRNGGATAVAANGSSPAASVSHRDSRGASTDSLGSTGSSGQRLPQRSSSDLNGSPTGDSEQGMVVQGETKFFSLAPKFPFARLQILGDVADVEVESTMKQLQVEALAEQQAAPSSGGTATAPGDSRRSLHPYGSYSERSASLGSSRSLDGQSGDSARSMRPSSSQRTIQGPGGASHNSHNLAEQPIDELSVAVPVEAAAPGASLQEQHGQAEPLGEQRLESLQSLGSSGEPLLRPLPSLPSLPGWKDDFAEADFSVRSGRRSSREYEQPLGERRRGGDSIRNLLRELDPLQRFVGCKRRKCARSVAPCKWDLFPGIAVGGDGKRRGLPMARLQHLQPSGSSQSDLAAAAAESAPGSNSGAGGEEKAALGGESPRGPLSVEDSESTRSSERDLARTFGLNELESAENMGSGDGSSDAWNAPASSGRESTSSAGGRSKARTAPEPARPQMDAAPRLQHSATAPALGSSGAAVKATAKLHVEHYKGLTFVNEYALAGTLGRGSFGTVKLALNTRDHELYALKLIPKSRRGKRRAAAGQPLVAEAEVMQEITVMKGLSHPNIVRLVEVIDDPANSKMLMVLEYVEGGALFAGTKLAPRKRLTELSARKYFRDVLQGLDYLHANQIAHGDLKPDNLLLGADGHIKIADFGSSQLTRCCDLVSRTAGTPAFMAPEMCSGQPYHARMADVWALGVCLYMSIFGTVPFKADGILALYDQICNAPLTFPADAFVSDSLKHLLTRLLDKDPESRISLPSVMAHHWVTHNGAYPLPNIQGLEADEEEDEASLLMECWPDDPADIGLESVLKTIKPLFEQRQYAAGAPLAIQGSPATCIFYVNGGEVEVFHKRSDEAVDDASEDEASDGEGEGRPRLKRQGSMLKTMFCATVRASRLVSAVRDYADGGRTLLATRGPGSFIGEVSVFAHGKDAKWQTCVRAKTDANVLVLQFKNIMEMVRKRPEIEGDIRAIMAQRRGELLKMNVLEKLAGLHRDLKEEVAAVTLANGATAEQIRIARELLGLPRASEDILRGPVDVGLLSAEAAAAQAAPELQQAAGQEQQQEQPASPLQSFESKGDSAKTLSLFAAKSSGKGQAAEMPPSPFSAAH